MYKTDSFYMIWTWEAVSYVSRQHAKYMGSSTGEGCIVLWTGFIGTCNSPSWRSWGLWNPKVYYWGNSAARICLSLKLQQSGLRKYKSWEGTTKQVSHLYGVTTSNRHTFV